MKNLRFIDGIGTISWCFTVKDSAACLIKAEELYGPAVRCVDHLDGLSIEIGNVGFNLSKSNTEPLVQLTVETRGDADLPAAETKEFMCFIEDLST